MGGKFSSVFKSLDSLRVVASNVETIAKSADVAVAASPVSRPVYSHVATQNLAKSLREAAGGGYWASVKDRRYDEAVVTALSKSGASDSQIGEFLTSDQGGQLGVTLHVGIAKTLGLGVHVKRMYSQWQGRDSRPVAKVQLRKSATEFIAKDNPNHDEKGRFASGSNAAMRSEGKGAVTSTTEETDKFGVKRVVLRSTIGGAEVSLKMRPETMDGIRSGTIKVNPEFLPEKWGAGGEDPKREEFDAANGYTPQPEMVAKYGKDSDAVRLNGDLGKKLTQAWGQMEKAASFEPGEAMHSALMYKAEENAKHAASDIVPELEFAKTHDGNIPVPISKPDPGQTVASEYAKFTKTYGNSIDYTIETPKGAVDAELRYNHRTGYPASQTEPAAGAEIDYRAFVREKGQPPFELDAAKVPGLDKKLVEYIADNHGRGG